MAKILLHVGSALLFAVCEAAGLIRRLPLKWQPIVIYYAARITLYMRLPVEEVTEGSLQLAAPAHLPALLCDILLLSDLTEPGCFYTYTC